MTGVEEFPGGRPLPTKILITDNVKKESSTRLEFKELEFGIALEQEVFARWLERHSSEASGAHVCRPLHRALTHAERSRAVGSWHRT